MAAEHDNDEKMNICACVWTHPDSVVELRDEDDRTDFITEFYGTSDESLIYPVAYRTRASYHNDVIDGKEEVVADEVVIDILNRSGTVVRQLTYGGDSLQTMKLSNDDDESAASFDSKSFHSFVQQLSSTLLTSMQKQCGESADSPSS